MSLGAQDDAATYSKVEKARNEFPACREKLEKSQAAGSMPMLLMKYAELSQKAAELTHCGFVFRIVGDSQRADDAGTESDRYDAVAALQMERYLKTKGLWDDFLKQDCRTVGSSQCGK